MSYSYLQPNTSIYAEPLEGLTLHQFIQAWIVGVSGLGQTLVVPRWQPEPANIPAASTCFAAVGITSRPADMFPAVMHDISGYDTVKKHEVLDILLSFYDLGFSGQADYYASRMRDGLNIDQNRWVLQQNGFGIAEVGNLLTVPSLLKERWLYRCDLEIRMHREIRRAYPVPDIAASQFAVVSQAVFNVDPGLANNNGVLYLVGSGATGWPTSPTNLPNGAVWNNGGIVMTTAITQGSPVQTLYFPGVTAAQLLASGVAGLTTKRPKDDSTLLWNNGGVICVA